MDARLRTSDRKAVLSLLRIRGTTLDAVRPAIVAEDGEQITYDPTHPAWPSDPTRKDRPPAKPPPDTRTGPERWAWLHGQDWYAVTDTPAMLAAILALADGLPGCACKRDWRADVAVNPPPLNSPASMRRWAYDRHQHVNERRGVAGISFDQACRP